MKYIYANEVVSKVVEKNIKITFIIISVQNYDFVSLNVENYIWIIMKR